MPVQVTYPGVYIEELPSGNHSIVGAPTAITAFVGRAPKGPVDQAHTVTSFGDFEKFFGSLNFDYPLTYAIKDFFLNGGGEAIIIRRFIVPETYAEKSTANDQSTGGTTERSTANDQSTSSTTQVAAGTKKGKNS